MSSARIVRSGVVCAPLALVLTVLVRGHMKGEAPGAQDGVPARWYPSVFLPARAGEASASVHDRRLVGPSGSIGAAAAGLAELERRGRAPPRRPRLVAGHALHGAIGREPACSAS